MNTERYAIQNRYLRPPSSEEISSFVESLDLTYAHFERLYGIPAGIIKSVRGGFKEMPVKYWKIFYEQITPTEFIKIQAKIIKLSKKQPVSRNVSNKTPNSGILSKLKDISDKED